MGKGPSGGGVDRARDGGDRAVRRSRHDRRSSYDIAPRWAADADHGRPTRAVIGAVRTESSWWGADALIVSITFVEGRWVLCVLAGSPTRGPRLARPLTRPSPAAAARSRPARV